jgi:hypothetical protein
MNRPPNLLVLVVSWISVGLLLLIAALAVAVR